MDLHIEHDPAAGRFSTTVDGQTCELTYRLSGNTMTITHTGVPSAVGGRGIAAELAKTAFETARSNGWKVVPACSYAAVYAQRHPEYADLLA